MSRGEGAHQRGATILIAEDNPVQAFELTTILSDHGYRVLAAKNGLEALAFARNDLPDLIVSDIIMPGMDGYDLCESLKSDPRTEEIPVILVTSLSNPHDVFRGLNAGADNFIVKPYREEALLDQTEYLLANRRVRRMGRSEVGIEIELGGQRQFITAARQQILDLLISTYEQAVRLYSDLDLRQQELTKSYNTLNALYDIANGLNLCRSEFEVAQSAVERGGRLPGVQAAWFYIKGGDGFRLGAASGAPPALFVDGEEEDCPCQRGMREGTLGLTATMTECRRLPRSEASGELRYHACVPLNANGEAIGILNLVGAERKMFSSDELRTLSAVGSQIAVAYERARTREELERRVEERTAQLRDEVEAHKRAEERLRLMGAVFENSREAFLVTDADHRTVLVNRAFARLTGYASAEMIGRVPDFLAADPDSVRVTMSRLETVAATGFWQGESLGRRKDGSLFPRWLLLSSIRDEAGEVAYHISAFSDVSDIKTKEERLLLLASVFENAAEAIKVFDADMRIVAVNPAFTALTGYSREEVIGRSALILSPSGQADPVVEEAIAIAGATGLWQGETRARRKDGELFPRWLTLSIIRGEAGAVLFHVASFLDITQQKHSQEEIYRLAHHDGLTGLPNRLNLEARLDQALAAANRAGHKVAVLLLDMDRFKTINDTLGHAIGDRLLVELGHRLEGSVRETDIVARHGGDEFIVALTDLVTPGQVATIIEKINQELARPYALDEHQLYSTISIGVSIYPDDGSSLAELLKNAEFAMYNAKSDGRNTFRFFTASMNKDAGERLALESGMRLAVERGEFLLHYQPQIEVASGEVLGFEALMRWQRPGQGMVSPGKFIPIAEETGLIVELGTFALREGLRQLRDWRDAGHQGGRVAINLSAHQLRDHAFPDLVRETLAAYRLEPGALELEITESVAMKDPQSTIALLNQLRDNGIELAIDDFGTGYSSMAYLKLLPIQRLKLDQSFVRDIETDPNDAAICTATIALAHSLGLEVVAEGVETEGQYQYLRRLGCNIVQGYFFGRPMPPDQAGPLLGKRVAGS